MKTFTEQDYEYNRAGYRSCLIVFTVGLAALVLPGLWPGHEGKMTKKLRQTTLAEVHAAERANFVPPGYTWFLCPRCGRGHIVQGAPVCPKEKKERES